MIYKIKYGVEQQQHTIYLSGVDVSNFEMAALILVDNISYVAEEDVHPRLLSIELTQDYRRDSLIEFIGIDRFDTRVDSPEVIRTRILDLFNADLITGRKNKDHNAIGIVEIYKYRPTPWQTI